MTVIGAGKTLLLSEPPLYKPHLWIVVSDPDGKPPRVVAVMLRTATKFTDPTLVLRPGDHPFIRHETSVHFSTARYFALSGLVEAMRLGRCHVRENISAELLKRVREGLLASPFTVIAIRDYCRARF